MSYMALELQGSSATWPSKTELSCKALLKQSYKALLKQSCKALFELSYMAPELHGSLAT